MRPTIVLVLDACRTDYINKADMPYVAGLAGNALYYRELLPSYGFCERTEILVGKTAKESGFFTAIGFNPSESPYVSIKPILRLDNLVERLGINLVKRIYRRLIWELVSRKENGFPPVNIPLKYIDRFSLTEDGGGSLIKNSSESLYKIAQRSNVFVDDSSFTSLDEKNQGDDIKRLSNVLDKVAGKKDGVFLAYISCCDAYGHKYGPNSKMFRNRLKELDKQISDFHMKLLSIAEDANLVLIGDHGMTTISRKIDVRQIVKDSMEPFVEGRDYLIFADSTVFRLWASNESQTNEILVKANEIFDSAVLGKNFFKIDRDQLGISESDRTYGDLAWGAKLGTVISPDFFNPKSKQLEGMHGYFPGDPSTLGMAIFAGPSFDPQMIERGELTVTYEQLRKVIEGK